MRRCAGCEFANLRIISKFADSQRINYLCESAVECRVWIGCGVVVEWLWSDCGVPVEWLPVCSDCGVWVWSVECGVTVECGVWSGGLNGRTLHSITPGSPRLKPRRLACARTLGSIECASHQVNTVDLNSTFDPEPRINIFSHESTLFLTQRVKLRESRVI